MSLRAWSMSWKRCCRDTFWKAAAMSSCRMTQSGCIDFCICIALTMAFLPSLKPTPNCCLSLGMT